MTEKILAQLDYMRIRDEIAGYCMSSDGKRALLSRLPWTDESIINAYKAESSEWLSYRCGFTAPALAGWNDAEELFPRLRVEGAVLDAEQMYRLGSFCKAVILFTGVFSSIKDASVSRSAVSFPHLEQAAAHVPSMEKPSSLISRVIDDSGEIRDLPEIRAIKASILRIRKDIDALMKSYAADTSLRGVLQSDIPVLRSDRQVLAVKANFRGRIKGIVHEVSQTGQTVYLEPDDVVQRNNDLVQEESRLYQEILRILAELTASLGEFADDFEKAFTVMVRLDTTHAAARWAQEIKGVFAGNVEGSTGSAVDMNGTTVSNVRSQSVESSSDAAAGDAAFAPLLLKARHPLLGSKAVPIDIQFLPACRILIITGPNTGGKTVTLKTFALFAMLNQSGFPVPAAEGTRLPVFTSVFADIGDEQSLDNSLSTFSGHMKNIAECVEHAGSGSLVLLDELGSGTDPLEGGAVAMAVLDELLEKNAFVLVTTHHGILKNYAYTHPSCFNASVEFNQTTLSPTYRIVMGVPGESHALDIAQRSGLPARIVDKARSYTDSGQADVSALIKGLAEKHAQAAAREKEIDQKERKIHDKLRKVDLKDLRVKQKEMELREQGYRRSAAFVEESRKMLENLVRELREGEITREKTVSVKDAIAQLEQAVQSEKNAMDTVRAQLEQPSDSQQEKTPHLSLAESPVFSVGDEVLAGHAKRRGVIAAPAKKNAWYVQFGSLRMVFNEKDLIQSTPSSERKPESVSITVMSSEPESSADKREVFGTQAADKPAFELRLLGMRFEQAEKALERQLDLCAVHNLNSFSVIHGKGNGVLQECVHKILSRYPGVAEYHFARPEDGGTGKTYVTLK